MSSPLERYLREVAVQLHELPADEREEQIEEIRVHIGTYADQHKSLGKRDAEAEEMALLQFGDAAKVGSEILKARTRRIRRVIGLAALLALTLTIALSYLNIRPLPVQPFGESAVFWIALELRTTLSMGVFWGLVLRKLAVRWIGWFYFIMLIPAIVLELFPPHGVHIHPFGVTTHSSLLLATINLVTDGARIAIVYAGALIGARMAGKLLNKARVSAAG